MNRRLLVELIRTQLAAQLAAAHAEQNDGRLAPSGCPLTLTVDHKLVSAMANDLASQILMADLSDDDED